MSYKAVILFALVAVASAGDLGLHDSGVYAPEHYRVAEHENLNPHYTFGYEIKDTITGDEKSQKESRTGDIVEGQYSLVEADGTRRIVDYTADALHGFNAVVRKEPTFETAVVADTPIVKTPIVEAPIIKTPLIEAGLQLPSSVLSVNVPLSIPALPLPLSLPAPALPPVLPAPILSAPVHSVHPSRVLSSSIIQSPIVEARTTFPRSVLEARPWDRIIEGRPTFARSVVDPRPLNSIFSARLPYAATRSWTGLPLSYAARNLW